MNKSFIPLSLPNSLTRAMKNVSELWESRKVPSCHSDSPTKLMRWSAGMTVNRSQVADAQFCCNTLACTCPNHSLTWCCSSENSMPCKHSCVRPGRM